jgi:hypothetical protein
VTLCLKPSRVGGTPGRATWLAEQQLAIHRAKLAAYLEDARLEEPRDTPERGRRTTERGRRTTERGRRTTERGRRTTERGRRTTERWRGETLRMGLRYEEAAVGFWEGVVSDARVTAYAD